MADVVRFSYSSSSLLSSLNNLQPLTNFKQNRCVKTRVSRSVDSTSSTSTLVSINNRRDSFLKVYAVISEATDQPKWWERNAGPNMIDIHSTEEFLSALSEAGDRLVIVEFYGTWCASCRALFPKLCRTATEHPEILFLKVNFDENKAMCKSMNVKVLPYFHFYRGAACKVEGFSCSLAKFQKIKDAIEMYNPGSSSNNSPAKDDAGLSLESSANVEDNPSENSNT